MGNPPQSYGTSITCRHTVLPGAGERTPSSVYCSGSPTAVHAGQPALCGSRPKSPHISVDWGTCRVLYANLFIVLLCMCMCILFVFFAFSFVAFSFSTLILLVGSFDLQKPSPI